MNLRKIKLILAIIGAILSIALVGIKIRNEIVLSRNAVVVPPAVLPQKMTYTITVSREVVASDKK